jgi:ADP-ribosyl-[dinitrogen reductase] hydrolase
MNTPIDKFTGCILGAAIGDALGMPNEDLTLEERDLYYGGEIRDFTDPHKNTPCRFLKAGQYTDDTQLILAVSESLIESEGFDPDSISRKLIQWLDMREEKRYRGEATKRGIQNLKKGIPWQEAGIDKAGCGSSTRAIPFGLYYYSNVGESMKYARLSSCMTHNNDVAKDGAALVTFMISNLIKGHIVPFTQLNEIVETIEMKNKLDDVARCLTNSDSIEKGVEVIGNSSMAHEVVGLASFIFSSNMSDFKSAVIVGANAVGKGKRGDTDSIACLVGAMSGAYNGISSIPKKWLNGIENREKLATIAKKLFEVSNP